jgi:hypothetical protein
MSTIPNRSTERAGRSGGLRAASLALVMIAASGATAAGEPPAAKADKPAETGVELLVDPAPEPTPAFKYHLLPPSEELRPGNAAPIYLRVTYERNDESRRRLNDEPARFLEMPREELPLEEVGKFLNSFGGVTEQMTAASYRSDCNWEYVTEDRDPLTILLPDMQAMRSFGRLLALKARYEIQTGDLHAAAGTLQDGLALCRHVARAPFLVNQLVGAAIADLIFGEVEAFVAQPGAANLYWALATLPRPFISFQRGLATERRLLVMRFPDLADIDHPRSEQEWQRLLDAMRRWSGEVLAEEQGSNPIAKLFEQSGKTATPQQIEMAAAYLRDKMQLPAGKLEAMSQAEVEVRYSVAIYYEIVDAWQKWFFVPYPHALPRFPQLIETLRVRARQRELFPLATAITPTGGNILASQARSDRLVARLQAIEALRMHAASTGTLPENLADVTVVPVPYDPATGAPFLYTRDKDVAVLDVADESARAALRMPVRIRLRAK